MATISRECRNEFGWKTALSLPWVCLAVLQAAPDADWVQGSGYRYRELSVPASGRSHLTEVLPAETGIEFRSDVPKQKGDENSIRLGGTGVAAGDVDGDGKVDLFFCSMGGRCALYRNLGQWGFEDITSQAGVGCEGQDSTGAVFADVDGDGDLDLLINSIGGGTRLFLNNGKGHFTEAKDCGLIRKHGSNSLALADIDGNGTLDLYVANFATSKIEDHPNTRIQTTVLNGKMEIAAVNGVPITSPELTNRYLIDPLDRAIRERGEPDVLYLNDGHGHFTPLAWTGGRFMNHDGSVLGLAPYDWGLSVMFRDLNGDGAPDIYVCNDLFTPDRIWINDGHGSFRILSSLSVRQTSLFSMGVDFADINRDGYDDFVVVDMLTPSLAKQKVEIAGVRYPPLPVGEFDNRPQYKRNTLFLNRGDATFAEIGQLSGLEATGWSWAPVFLDVDLDGFEDLLVTTGYYRDALNADAIAKMRKMRGNRKLSDPEFIELKRSFPELPLECRAFRNRGNLRFEDKSAEWGFNYLGISQGICLADLDNDGDLDVVVARENAPVGIYRNESSAPRVAVRLKGKTPNTRGIGAKIRFQGGPVAQSQEMICGGRYLSGDDAMRVFATGSATQGLSIEVTWRSGQRSTVTDVRPNRLYEIEELDVPSNAGHHEQVDQNNDQKGRALFEDASQLLTLLHHEEFFDDFERQPTLPRKLSQLGPGVSWFDVDGDGWDDLLIGSGKGGALAVYRNTGHGRFSRLPDALLDQPSPRDYTTVLGLDLGQGRRAILAGLSNYEDGLTNGVMVRMFEPGRSRAADVLPAQLASAGPLALADIDGDGELDLFTGGRVIPGKYPQAAPSWLFRGHAGQFRLDVMNSAPLAGIGLVSGAVFSDLDGDGYPELILACEWGPIRVFHNDHGKLSEITAALGLNAYSGWWNGVTVGDFDGDGRMDIVASNWGQNSKYQSYRGRPVRLFYSGEEEAIPFLAVESSYDPILEKWLPWCGLTTMQKARPEIRSRFATLQAYGNASVTELFGPTAKPPKYLEAYCLESTIFLNRGDHFEAKPLPLPAQFSPAFGVSVADFDGDGNEDIFLAQNFAAVDSETARYDAGRGLVLEGDGHGGFKPVELSGVKVYGDQRGCAVADYDRDGRTDLVVTQNGAATALYHNVGARTGLRIRLEGSGGNVGIGAVIRLVSNGQMGPAREVHAGSGYWSQDSPVQVMDLQSKPDQIWVRWPGGKATRASIPSNAAEITLSIKGTVAAPR